MNSKTTTNIKQTPTEINTYIDHVIQSLNIDYDYLHTYIRVLSDDEGVNKSKALKLQWMLTNIHTDMVNMHMSMKETQKLLREVVSAS